MSDLQNTGIPVPPAIQPGFNDDNTTSQTSNSGNNLNGDQEEKKEEEVVVPIGNFGVGNDFHTKIKLPEHETSVEEEYFLSLLVGSISLSIEEKRKIVDNFGALNQFQVDELIKIFEEEKSKFSALDIKHKEQLEKLQQQHLNAWDTYEISTQQEIESEEEIDEAEDIRKSLGL